MIVFERNSEHHKENGKGKYAPALIVSHRRSYSPPHISIRHDTLGGFFTPPGGSLMPFGDPACFRFDCIPARPIHRLHKRGIRGVPCFRGLPSTPSCRRGRRESMWASRGLMLSRSWEGMSSPYRPAKAWHARRKGANLCGYGRIWVCRTAPVSADEGKGATPPSRAQWPPCRLGRRQSEAPTERPASTIKVTVHGAES
jgi:hypothetical protein